jgi:hypothetical protein
MFNPFSPLIAHLVWVCLLCAPSVGNAAPKPDKVTRGLTGANRPFSADVETRIHRLLTKRPVGRQVAIIALDNISVINDIAHMVTLRLFEIAAPCARRGPWRQLLPKKLFRLCRRGVDHDSRQTFFVAAAAHYQALCQKSPLRCKRWAAKLFAGLRVDRAKRLIAEVIEQQLSAPGCRRQLRAGLSFAHGRACMTPSKSCSPIWLATTSIAG